MSKILSVIHLEDHYIDDFIKHNLICDNIRGVNKTTNVDNIIDDSIFLLPNPFNFVCDVITNLVIQGKDSEIEHSTNSLLKKLDDWSNFATVCDKKKLLVYDDFVYSENYRLKIAESLEITDHKFWQYTDTVFNINKLSPDDRWLFESNAMWRNESWFKALFKKSLLTETKSEIILEREPELYKFNFYRNEEWFISLFKARRKIIQQYLTLFNLELDKNKNENFIKILL